MTYPNQAPRPGPPPGGFRPGPPPGGFRPGPPPQGAGQPGEQTARTDPEYRLDATGGTGHPAVDAVLQSLANAATLAPGDQIAEYEAAHQVLQETLASIDR
ncbi:hypothetical protein ACQP2Y_33085 [Actinoplanes sp. CA-051413]|uniref:hypothetical protein n=1 Tax=Actinoplanes sp. CA-051413 TaxID=3239899 RepID=UPI003D98C5EC